LLQRLGCSFRIYVYLRTFKKTPHSISVDQRCWELGCVENNVAVEKTN
jgi:hypothetical protein